MKKQKKAVKKLSLDKLQVAKITIGLNSIIGGSNLNTGDVATDTDKDKTNSKPTVSIKI